MTTATLLLQSTVGRKMVMATTGVVWIGFVVAHLLGNLLVFAGPDAINAYGAFLQEGTHGAIWIARLVLAASMVLHVWAAVSLTRTNHDARPHRYAGGRRNQRTSYAALTMRYGGAVLVAFVLFHLAHLTLGVVDPGTHVHGDVYGNLVRAFEVPWLTATYLAAVSALALHLYHGIRGATQTLGLTNLDVFGRPAAALLSVSILVGYASIPLAVQLGALEISP